ncbi:MAG: GNAT family N-acetyltransferase [Lacunisphaera sp.]
MKNNYGKLSLHLRAANTELIGAEDYSSHYERWGGSFINHPEVLRYFAETHHVTPAFRGYFRAGRCIGAVATWGSFVAGDRSALHAFQLEDRDDFGYPLVYLPIDPQYACTVRFKARYLINPQRPQIGGAVFTRLKKMALLKNIPDALLTGKKEYQIKERRFQRSGGTIRDIHEFSCDEIVTMYTDLFYQRWQRAPHAIGSLKRTIGALQKFLFGKILWLEGRPIAIQLNYRAETARTICIDYINGGVDKSLKELSPGSLLSYINGRDACADSQRSGKLLFYSYGKANTDYKNQWCDRVSRGFTGVWLP